MRRIAVINQKGGVGKTTTVANLGAALARSGRRVLLVDLDPQAHLTLHYGVELAEDQPSIYDVLTEALPLGKAALNPRKNIRIIPADIDLAAAEAELISVTGREVILREALDAAEPDCDVMLIDCPPSLGIMTVNALVAAREVLIPLQAQFFALQGLGKLLDTVSLVRQRINPHLTVGGVILCMHESTTRLAGEVVADLTRFLDKARGTELPWAQAGIYQTGIRRNIKLAESSSFGQTIFEYAPRSNGAADYAALAAEIFDLPASSAPPGPESAKVGGQRMIAGVKPEESAADESADMSAEMIADVLLSPAPLALPASADFPPRGAVATTPQLRRSPDHDAGEG